MIAQVRCFSMLIGAEMLYSVIDLGSTLSSFDSVLGLSGFIVMLH